MKSSAKRGHQILGMTEKRARTFLLDCANLRHTPESKEAEFGRLLTRYADILPHPVLYTHRLALSSALAFFSSLLREGWSRPTQREREWYFREAEVFGRFLTAKDADKAQWYDSHGSSESPDHVFGVMYNFVKPPAQASPLEAVFHYLWRNAKHALRCANPECPAPYFFATKKSQKYCSPECAQPARRASKLRWWNDNRAGKPKTKKEKQKGRRSQ
jgi:hypothetical protein